MKARKKVFIIYCISLLSTIPTVMKGILSCIEVSFDIVCILIGSCILEGIIYGSVITLIALCLRIITIKQLKENL